MLEAGKFKVKLITDLVSTDSLSIIDDNHYPYLIERLSKLPQKVSLSVFVTSLSTRCSTSQKVLHGELSLNVQSECGNIKIQATPSIADLYFLIEILD